MLSQKELNDIKERLYNLESEAQNRLERQNGINFRLKDIEKNMNKTKKLKRIRITELELLFCPKENEIIQFDKKCVECKHFNGHYSATGYIGCDF